MMGEVVVELRELVADEQGRSVVDALDQAGIRGLFGCSLFLCGRG